MSQPGFNQRANSLLKRFLAIHWLKTYASIFLVIIALLIPVISAWESPKGTTESASGRYGDNAFYSFTVKPDGTTDCTRVNWSVEGVHSLYVVNQRVGLIPETYQPITDSGELVTCSLRILTEINHMDGTTWSHEFVRFPGDTTSKQVSPLVLGISFSLLLVALAIHRTDWIGSVRKKENLQQIYAWMVSLWVIGVVLFYILRFSLPEISPDVSQALNDIDDFLHADRITRE